VDGDHFVCAQEGVCAGLVAARPAQGSGGGAQLVLGVYDASFLWAFSKASRISLAMRPLSATV
jgi:hypothetical protein